ncbi:MAG: glycosyltransferase [Actinomycetota bacterium]|nr:glycosyltransferase [Actinomycetota bacterium]
MSARKIGYVTSRFPKLTETFILYEILGLEREGFEVEFYPLQRERTSVLHPEAIPVMERAHYLPFVSRTILRSQLDLVRKSPRTYVGTLVSVLRGTFGSLKFLAGGIVFFPKVAHAARLLSEEGVTHVHCHFATHAALAGFVIHRLTGIPYSFTAAGSDLHVDRRMLCQKVAEAAFVVAISNYNRDVIADECGEASLRKVRVIRSGIDTSFFRPRESGRSSGRFRILCVGTLHEVKGQTYLIEACRLLADAGVDVVCELVGDGPDRAALMRQIEAAGLTGRVTLLGARTRHEVAESLALADVVATPSVPTKGGRREGIPVVLMEALACGLPVVASAISGIPELVEHERTGLLVPPGDPAGLAQALRRLHDDVALSRRLGAAGREKVVREYDAYGNAVRLAREIAQIDEVDREKAPASPL